jgi:hypothetical protein
MESEVHTDTNQLVSDLMFERMGEEWRLELAKSGNKVSYASKRHGSRNWAEKLAEKLLKSSDEYEFIGIFSEGESTEGPILEGVVYHCTEFYLKKSPYMYFEKKDACRYTLRTKKPTEYVEG